MRAVAAFLLFVACFLPSTANAVEPSRCLAMAGAPPPFLKVAYRPVSLKPGEVRITFVGHSTFRIESPGGVIVATDYAGFAGQGRVPDVVTMNHAHETHYTDFPDPKIKHVLRGWNPKGGAASHNMTVGDVKIRNVPTDIRHWSGQRETDGNSIFIFEVAGLCIGHLGHLHHELSPQHIGWIGRLDIVMVPVDGTYTMAQKNMIEVLKTLRARIVLPMHYFSVGRLNDFAAGLKGVFLVRVEASPEIIVSEVTLPSEPTVYILPGR